MALCKGIVAAGDEVFRLNGGAPPDATVAVASNWGAAVDLYGMGYERVAVVECGYLGNRNWWCSLSLDGLNGRGIHAETPERPEPMLEPWRGARDGYALILGQVPTDWAVRVALKHPYEAWLAETTRDLERRGYEVRFREHPYVTALKPAPPEPPRDRAMRHRARLPPPPRPTLRQELEGARIAVTLNSTSAIEAVCMGVPTIVYDRGCMAWAVSSEFGSFAEPSNRRAWVNRLVRLQWSMDELGDGTAWRAIRAVL